MAASGDVEITKLGEEMKLEHVECVVCCRCSSQTLDLMSSTTASGTSFLRFFARYTQHNLLTASSTRICKNCCDLIDVLEQAELDYLKLKDTFEAIISENPLFKIHIENPKPVVKLERDLDKYHDVRDNNESDEEPMAVAKKRPRKLEMKISQANQKRQATDSDRWSCRKCGAAAHMCTVYKDVITDLPPVLELKNEKENSVDRFIVCGGSSTSSRTGTLMQPPVRPTRAHSRPRRRKRDADNEEHLNYGSEASDEDQDDHSLVPVILPRVVVGTMDTPEDEVAECSSPRPPSPVEVPEPNETLLPHGFFDFEWKKFPSPPIPPELRREPFSASEVGPTTPCKDPYEIFVSIWDPHIMEHIAAATNSYAQEVAKLKMQRNTMGPSSRICKWEETTPDELYTYFAIILSMGVVVKAEFEEYWTSDGTIFVTPGFAAHMSLKRFQLLNTCLHFNRNSGMRVQQLRQSKAKLYKIEPILTHLNRKFQELYNMSQNIALDESLLQWKGWLNMNKFISNNAGSAGIKTYEICECQTGYLWRFEVHAHPKASPPLHQQQQSPLDASTPKLVLNLVQGLESKGHTLWMDNYYNSPALTRKLKSLGFDVVGTLRTNREFVPEDLTQLNKVSMRQGQIAGYTSGDVDLMVWCDQNRVATISTYHGNTTAVVEGKVKPKIICDYNIMMGGVDEKDQLLAMYPIERKRTKVWYKKLFRRLLNVSVLNAYIIAKQSSSHLSHRSFRQSVIISILSRHSNLRRIAPQILPPKFEAKEHPLTEYPLGQSGSRLRRKCCVCPNRTHFYCAGCAKSVCISSCWVALHS